MLDLSNLVDFQTYYIVHDWYGEETTTKVWWCEDTERFYTDSVMINPAHVKRAIRIPELPELEQLFSVVTAVANAMPTEIVADKYHTIQLAPDIIKLAEQLSERLSCQMNSTQTTPDPSQNSLP